MLPCTAKLSFTRATSPRVTGAPLNTPIGNSLNFSTDGGLEFSWTLYSRSPIRAVPAGTITLEACSAFTTSVGVKPLATSKAGSRSTIICRDFPPNGAGVERPGMVNSRMRMKFRL